MKIHYDVLGESYSRPLLALEAANRLSALPTLKLSATFDSFNWTLPVTQSVSALEDERVKQIAAKGQPIRLMYSGGSDSHTIADAFLRNRIAIRYTLLEYTNLTGTQLDGDRIMGLKLDRLTRLHRSYGMALPEYEIIRIDSTKIEEHFTTNFFEHSSYYNCNQSFNVNQTESTLRWSRWAPETTINVYGIEKPRIYLDDVGLYWQITDTMSMYAHSTQYDSTWFYIHEDLPELIQAQAMGAYRYAKLHMSDLPLVDALHALQTDKTHYHTWCLSLGRKIEYTWAMHSKQSKVYHSTFENPTDPRYNHIVRYRDDKASQAWKNYQSLFQTLKDITGKSTITPITTSKYYLLRHTS